MDQSEVLELRRRFVRRGWFWWGGLMAIASPLIVFGASSGPVLVQLIISAITALAAFYMGRMWAEVMWLIFKDQIVRTAEFRAKRAKA